MKKEVRYYYKEYSNNHRVYFNRKLKTIENFIDDIPIIEETIGFQFWFDDMIAKILNSNNNEVNTSNKEELNIATQIAISHTLFRKNMLNLYSAFDMASADLYNASYTILRTVHESILMMNYLATHPNESQDIQNFMKRKHDKIKFYMDNKNNTNKSRKNNKNKSYEPKVIRDGLYTNEMDAAMNSIYARLSMPAHPNIYESFGPLEEFNLERIKDCFWFIKLESFYNIVFHVENFSRKPNLVKKIVTPDVLSFTERLKTDIGGKDKQMADYFSNKGDLGKDFILYIPH